MTNREWLNSLSNEQFVDWLMTDYKWISYTYGNEISGMIKWLDSHHTFCQLDGNDFYYTQADINGEAALARKLYSQTAKQGECFEKKKEKAMNKNISELCKLIEENPELPVLARVNSDVCGINDNYAWWLGEITSCRVEEYTTDEWGGDGCYRDRSEEDIIIENIAEYKYDGSEEAYRKAKEEVETMWKKAIMIHVEAFRE